ncbi:YqhR family membrane protein [Saliterribacillus persicus]|uniref:Membrane protein YqhR n=1 Tax=Saliterribacillus persicus TaxID=930114 RepID=A0A368XC19_9BACI|nr:YqhR family membrane protein [Saliterribacillus persicus]RCW65395.1 membrane protein YqhR [Saliterribacillus persicus]
MSNKKNKSNYNPALRSLVTGFFGGLFWSSISYFGHLFHFTSVSPSTFILRLWYDYAWIEKWKGEILSILIISLLSSLVGLFYFFLLKKFIGVLVPLVFGCILWAVIFSSFSYLFPTLIHWSSLSSDTIVSTICLFLLYGLFIGYSINYDYAIHQEQSN